MSPRHLLSLTLAASLLGSPALHAGDPAPAAPATPATPATPAVPAEAPPPYQLKRKSSFTAHAEDQRAPFWPIGWVKRKRGQVVDAQRPMEPKVAVDEKSFRVTSTLLGNPSLAIINGRTYSEGEFLRQPRATGGAATVATSPIPPGARIRVQRIDDGSVVLQYEDQIIVAALQRPGLVPKKADDELLSDERP